VNKSFFQKLTIKDMPNKDMEDIAKLCGIGTAVKLLQNFPGTYLYIPKGGMTQMVKNHICKNFNGSNSRGLALETGYSQVHIYRILHSGEKEVPVDGQLDMFDDRSCR